MLEYVDSFSMSGYSVNEIESNIAHAVQLVFLQIDSDELQRLLHEKFSGTTPSEQSVHAVCLPYGITWGDIAMEFTRSQIQATPAATPANP